MRDGRSSVLVTHDLLDIVTLADEVIVLESGRVVESGPTGAMLAAPRRGYGARFAGISLVTGWQQIWHGILDEPHGSPRNTVEVVIAELDSRGPAFRVRAGQHPDGSPRLSADIAAESASDLRLAPGDSVYFSVTSQEVSLHPAR